MGALVAIRHQVSLLGKGIICSKHMRIHGVRMAKELKPEDFHDAKAIYRNKTTLELFQAFVSLQLSSFNFLVDHSMTIMQLVGRRMFQFFSRHIFYDQFVGGHNPKDLTKTVAFLKRSHLRLMACTGLEESSDASGSSKKYDRNKEVMMNINDILAKEGGTRPGLQLKVTAIMPAMVIIRLSHLLQSKLITMRGLVEKMEEKNVKLESLSNADNEALNLGIERLHQIGRSAKRNDVRLLIDAEYTCMNPGISAIALTMMMKLNQKEAVVVNTYQCYLKKTMDALREELKIIVEKDLCFGAKIVRGAYMEKERKQAEEDGIPDPVHDTYEDTGTMYNSVIHFLVVNLLSTPTSRRHHLVVATHNENGILNAIGKMRENQLPNNDEKIVFAQIYGMGEQLSMPLANAGYLVYKAVPYGPLHELLPYLSRRAAESRSILQVGTRKECQLLVSEISRRVFRRGNGEDTEHSM